MGRMKKVNKLNITGTIQPIFSILSPWIWENNWLLNENYWDALDIINQGHSKGNDLQCCLNILERILQDFDHNDGIATGNKKVLSSDLENVGQVHHLQKSLYLSYYTKGFHQTFIETKAESSAMNID